jgi:hypothetical protein
VDFPAAYNIYTIHVLGFYMIETLFQDFNSLRRRHGLGDVRKVQLHKDPEEGLGMSITVCGF